MRRIVVLALMGCLILAALHFQPMKAAVGGPTCYVPADYATITAAVADAGCIIIIVAAGTYDIGSGETFPITINGPRTLTLIGAGALTTIIDATGGGGADPDAIIVNNATVNIRGFTITGADDDGLEYTNGSSGIIENNTFNGNEYGIYNDGGSVTTIRNNLITGNSNEGIDTEDESNSTIENNIITGNGDGIGNDGSSPIIRNNSIIGNTENGIRNNDSGSIIINNIITYNGSDGIDCWDSEATITNNTIVGNADNGIRAELSVAPTIFNNIIVSNGKGEECVECAGIHDEDSQIEDGDLDYNDVWNNGPDGTNNYSQVLFPGPHDISANPLLTGDYHLQCASPALNAGSNSAPEIPSTDKDGEARIQNDTVDMGAYEGCQPIPIYRKIPSLLPTTQNNISQGNSLSKQAQDLLSQAKSKNLDTSTCEKLIDEAKGLLDKAKIHMTNPIYANNLALQAMEKLKQAIDCLKALLG